MQIKTSKEEQQAADDFDEGYNHMAKAVGAIYGLRCDRFEKGCPTCLAWGQLDGLRDTLGKAFNAN